MRHALLAGAVVAAVIAAPVLPLGTQQPPGTSEILLARADSITVGAYCVAAQRAVHVPAVRAALAGDSTEAVLAAARLCDATFAGFTLRALRGDRPPSVASIARVGVGHGPLAGMRRGVPANADVASLFDAMESLRTLLRGPAVRTVVRTALGDTANTALVRAAETAHGVLTLEARDASLRRLARYERKLGPTSARLNGPEVLLNYAASRWVPGFAPSAARGPGPLEVVASYVPTYATYVDRRPQAVSASEFGVRWYLFGEAFGRSGVQGILRPSYWSAGTVVTSDRNGALVWPWDARTRMGGFVSWGAVKVGYVPGRRGAWLVSRQTQIVPFVF
jgi:hypothetical protein